MPNRRTSTPPPRPHIPAPQQPPQLHGGKPVDPHRLPHDPAPQQPPRPGPIRPDPKAPHPPAPRQPGQ